MGIGNRIKEAREALNLTQTELGKLVGVTGSAITNYEKETSHPKEQVIYKLMDVLNVDANFLFQDVIKPKVQGYDITLTEYEFIKKYRELDERGRNHVNGALEQAYKSIPRYMEGQLSMFPVDGYIQIWKNGKWENYMDVDTFFADSDNINQRDRISMYYDLCKKKHGLLTKDDLDPHNE